jgi:glycosyltransferase involved in cell wall biosynthesis
MSNIQNEVFFSIVTVCLNAERTISRTLDSIYSQTFPKSNFEHIIVDGQSSDATLAIISKYPYSKWISEPDNGIADAFNKGLSRANGKYLLFLNADDYFANNHVLEKCYQFAVTHNYPPWFYGYVLIPINNTLGIYKRLLPPNEWGMMFGPKIDHQATFVDRDILRNLGGFNIQFKINMDYDLWQRLFEKGYTPVNCNLVISVFSTSGISSNFNKLSQNENFDIRMKFRNTRLKKILGNIIDIFVYSNITITLSKIINRKILPLIFKKPYES